MSDFPEFLSAAEFAARFKSERVTETYVTQRARSGRWPHVLISREPYFTPEHVAQIAVIESVPVKDSPASIAEAHGQRTRGRRAS